MMRWGIVNQFSFCLKRYQSTTPTTTQASNSLLGAIVKRKPSPQPIRPETLKPPKVEKHHFPLILLVAGVGTAVFAYDVYYYLYVHEPTRQTLSPDEFRNFKIKSIMQVSPTTSLFSFATANLSDEAKEYIPIPSHIVIKDDSCQIARSYTPITYSSDQFDVLVKLYQQGSVSRYIHSLMPGDKVQIRGPILTFPYERNMVKNIGMIAGGTGITPMYQLIKRILRDPQDQSQITLIYANQNEQEILLKNELEILASSHPGRLRIHYVLDTPPEGWTQSRGFITKDTLNKHLLPHVPPSFRQENPSLFDNIVLVCGPDPMVESLAGQKQGPKQGPLAGILKELNYTPDRVFKF